MDVYIDIDEHACGTEIETGKQVDTVRVQFNGTYVDVSEDTNIIALVLANIIISDVNAG